MQKRFSERLTVWLPRILVIQVALCLAIGGLYLAKTWSETPSAESPPDTAAAKHPENPEPTRKTSAEETTAVLEPKDGPPREPEPKPKPKPKLPPVVEIHNVGLLPEGVELRVAGPATLQKDPEGKTKILLHEPEPGMAGGATVNFLHAGQVVSKMELAPNPANAAGEPETIEWAVFAIEGSVPEMTFHVQGAGHMLTLPDGRAWLFAMRPNGEDWVKVLADRPGFKQSAALVHPKPGERPVLSFEMQKEAPPFEHSLPESVVLFVNVSRYGEFKERLNELRGVQLCQDPAMQPYVSQFLESSQTGRAELRQQTGVDLVNLCAAHTGQISIGLGLPDWQALAETAGSKGKRKKARTRKELDAERDAEKQLREMKPVWYFLSDIPGSRARISRMLKDVDRTGAADQMHLAITDNHVLFGAENPDEAEKLHTWLEKPPAAFLADNPRLKEFRKSTGGAGDFEIFIDLAQLWKFLKAKYSNPQFNLADGFLGAQLFQGGGFSFSIAQDQFDTVGHVVVHTTHRPALFHYLDFPPGPLQPEPWVPADITSYCTFRWKHTQTRELIALLRHLPELSSLDALGERLTIVTDLTESRGFAVPRMLLAWERRHIPGGDTSVKTLQLLLLQATEKASPITTKRKTPGGKTIILRDYGGQLEKRLGPDQPVPVGQVAFTVTDTHVFLATHVELLEKVLNHEGPGLAESPDFQRVAAHFPAECSLISFHTPEHKRLLFQALKTGRLPGILEGKFTTTLFAGLTQALDGRKLPEFDAIKRFFTPSGGYAIMDDSGFHYTFFSLKGE